jgi:hypothetical protein
LNTRFLFLSATLPAPLKDYELSCDRFLAAKGIIECLWRPFRTVLPF